MSTDPFREFALEQLAALEGLRCKRMFRRPDPYSGKVFFGILFDGWLYFRTYQDTSPGYLTVQAAVFAPSEKQTLRNYREFPAEILEDAVQLAARARKAARR